MKIEQASFHKFKIHLGKLFLLQLITLMFVLYVFNLNTYAQCPQGYTLIDETEDEYICIRNEKVQRYNEINEHLKRLKTRLAQDKNALEKWQQKLPGYLEALEEWEKAGKNALKDAVWQGANLGTGFLLKVKINSKTSAIVFKKDDIDEIRRNFNNPNFIRKLNEPTLVAEIHKLQSSADLYKIFEDLRKAADVAHWSKQDMPDIERALGGILKICKIVVQDPRVQRLLPAGGPLLQYGLTGIYTLYAATAFDKSWERINQLADVKQLEAATALSNTYKKHIDEQKKLLKEKEKILKGEKK